MQKCNFHFFEEVKKPRCTQLTYECRQKMISSKIGNLFAELFSLYDVELFPFEFVAGLVNSVVLV